MILIDFHLLTITSLVPTLLFFKSSKFYLTSSIPISLYLIGFRIPEPINLKNSSPTLFNSTIYSGSFEKYKEA